VKRIVLVGASLVAIYVAVFLALGGCGKGPPASVPPSYLTLVKPPGDYQRPETVVDRLTSDVLAAHPTWRRMRIACLLALGRISEAYDEALFMEKVGWRDSLDLYNAGFVFYCAGDFAGARRVADTLQSDPNMGMVGLRDAKESGLRLQNYIAMIEAAQRGDAKEVARIITGWRENPLGDSLITAAILSLPQLGGISEEDFVHALGIDSYEWKRGNALRLGAKLMMHCVAGLRERVIAAVNESEIEDSGFLPDVTWPGPLTAENGRWRLTDQELAIYEVLRGTGDYVWWHDIREGKAPSTFQRLYEITRKAVAGYRDGDEDRSATSYYVTKQPYLYTCTALFCTRLLLAAATTGDIPASLTEQVPERYLPAYFSDGKRDDSCHFPAYFDAAGFQMAFDLALLLRRLK